MDNKAKTNSGFSLLEAITSSAIILIIIISFYSLIISTQATQVTEENKTNMNQSIRAIDQLLCDNIRNAGSIFTLLNTPTFLNTTPPFSGIYPLNRNNYPDGIILASGDYEAVTELTIDFTPGSTTISVISTNNPSASDTAWALNDIGVVVRPDGYFIFKVTALVNFGDTQLSIRQTPVYYSGLLNISSGYTDFSGDTNHLATTGNSGSYSSGSPVFRLNYFSMFLTKTETDGTKTLTLTTDTEGVADVLATGNETSTRAIPIVPNIQDLQFEYITKSTPPELWASSSSHLTSYANPCANPGDANCPAFIQNFLTKNISSIRVYVLLKTEDKHKRKNIAEGAVGQSYNKSRMGDSPATTLPAGRFHYTYLTYEILIRNFNIIY